MDRRGFMKGSAALGLSMAPQTAKSQATAFWPGGARFVVSLSMQFETGAQPERGANPRTGNENLCPSHFAHATQLSSDARESKIAATTKWVGCFGGVLFRARCTRGLPLLAARR